MVEIVKLDDKDLNSVAELSYMVGKLHDEALPYIFKKTSKDEHLDILKNMQKDEKVEIKIAKIGEEVVGFVCVGMVEEKRKGYKGEKIGVIYNLGVKEQYRKKGVGKKLVEEALKWCEEKECYAVDLNVFWFNNGALEFYKNLGFGMIDVNLRKML